MKKYFKTTDKASVNNYPYGRLQCTAFFSLEHKAGSGFRSVFQTINPKTGRLNNPKKSTYAPIVAMYENTENNHIHYEHYSYYDNNSKIKCNKFLSENFNLFTPDQIKDIAIYCLNYLKVDIHAKNVYCNSPVDKLLELYNPAVNILVNIIKTGENLFNQINLNFTVIDSLEDKTFNAFKVQI